jgi:hypothetical protein
MDDAFAGDVDCPVIMRIGKWHIPTSPATRSGKRQWRRYGRRL